MNNPVVMTDPDGRDAIITITPGANGKNPTVTVLLVFHATNVNATAQAAFEANSAKHWEQKGLTYTSDNGVVYDVVYDIQVKNDNNPNTGKPYTEGTAPLGENTITFYLKMVRIVKMAQIIVMDI